MSHYTITARHTPRRHEWLQHLAERGVAQRDGWNMVPCQCMRLGWTDWEWAEGKTRLIGEKLTDEGRAQLAEWNAAVPPNAAVSGVSAAGRNHDE